jgi:predicted dehydrogenase
LAKAALDRGLHTFVEKPLATTTWECQELIETAADNHCLLFVGHVFLHAAPVRKLRQLITDGEIGEICYISGKRLNLGPVRKDVSSLFDLAPHDISIILYLLRQAPEWVSCAGLAHLHPDVHDVCNLTMQFADNRIGMVHVSWLDPKKERLITVVGDRKMAVYDDLAPEKIKIYDKGVNGPRQTDGDFASFQYSYRYGDSFCPWLNETEPLKSECADFVRCITEGDVTETDGENGLQVVQVLEAAQQSLALRGQPIELSRLSDSVRASAR